MSAGTSEQELRAAEQTFRSYLRHRGLKFTPERRRVLQEVLSGHQHFEADRLLGALRQSGRRVAKATIYRTLPLLVDCGILRQVRLDDKAVRYERSLGQTHHDHMVCLGCRRIIEFDSRGVVRLRRTIADACGFQAFSHRFQITGLCRECVAAPDAGPDRTGSGAPDGDSPVRHAGRLPGTPAISKARHKSAASGRRSSPCG